ncbi:PEST proteolytic signal-containing nuclear protein [Trichinella sp. T6]|nr:PEST proteolytic signal-containing nuclear protein [Trichinella sp. T6]
MQNNNLNYKFKCADKEFHLPFSKENHVCDAVSLSADEDIHETAFPLNIVGGKRKIEEAQQSTSASTEVSHKALSSKGKIKIKLKIHKTTESDNGSEQQKEETPKAQTLLKPLLNVFDDDSDGKEAEEMPAECRRRMRNFGRDTPTSSGPNSFSKGKHGFVDARKVAERRLQMMTREIDD